MDEITVLPGSELGGAGPKSVAREDHLCDARIVLPGLRGVNSGLVRIQTSDTSASSAESAENLVRYKRLVARVVETFGDEIKARSRRHNGYRFQTEP